MDISVTITKEEVQEAVLEWLRQHGVEVDAPSLQPIYVTGAEKSLEFDGMLALLEHEDYEKLPTKPVVEDQNWDDEILEDLPEGE